MKLMICIKNYCKEIIKNEILSHIIKEFRKDTQEQQGVYSKKLGDSTNTNFNSNNANNNIKHNENNKK